MNKPHFELDRCKYCGKPIIQKDEYAAEVYCSSKCRKEREKITNKPGVCVWCCGTADKDRNGKLLRCCNECDQEMSSFFNEIKEGCRREIKRLREKIQKDEEEGMTL